MVTLRIDKFLPVIYIYCAYFEVHLVGLAGVRAEGEREVAGEVEAVAGLLALVALHLVEQVERENGLRWGELLEAQDVLHFFVSLEIAQEVDAFSFAEQVDDQEQELFGVLLCLFSVFAVVLAQNAQQFPRRQFFLLPLHLLHELLEYDVEPGIFYRFRIGLLALLLRFLLLAGDDVPFGRLVLA